MKTYRTCALRSVKVLCIILSIFTLVVLTRSMQNEKTKNLQDDKYKYVALDIVPATPKVLNIPKGKVVEKKPKLRSVTFKDTSSSSVLSTYVGNISYYASDCRGCTGRTASGYDVRSNLYYNDSEYGTVRIVAGDKSLPFGTIIRINTNSGDILAIVLDRGGAIGFNRKYMFDLLCESENQASQLGVIKQTNVEVLRFGY